MINSQHPGKYYASPEEAKGVAEAFAEWARKDPDTQEYPNLWEPRIHHSVTILTFESKQRDAYHDGKFALAYINRGRVEAFDFYQGRP